jgi:CIC family chloride channel protein
MALHKLRVGDRRQGAELNAVQEDESHRLSLLYLTLLALALGIVTGLRAVLFRDLIGLLHNIFFAGRFVVGYDANFFAAPSRWGRWLS